MAVGAALLNGAAAAAMPGDATATSGHEGVCLRLLKGALRSVTGLIAHSPSSAPRTDENVTLLGLRG